jgi:hypothetical protein
MMLRILALLVATPLLRPIFKKVRRDSGIADLPEV